MFGLFETRRIVNVSTIAFVFAIDVLWYVLGIIPSGELLGKISIAGIESQIFFSATFITLGIVYGTGTTDSVCIVRRGVSFIVEHRIPNSELFPTRAAGYMPNVRPNRVHVNTAASAETVHA